MITGDGRLHAGDFRAIVGEAARTNTLEPLDRINGGLTDWPAGSRRHAYGVGFHEYLADRFGADKIAGWRRQRRGRFPYTSTKAFGRVYGESLGDLFREYEHGLLESVRPPDASIRGITRLTTQGFGVTAPRFDRFACAGCPPQRSLFRAESERLPWSVSPQPRRLTAGPLATRYLGNTTGIGRDAIYFDQLELRRNVGLYSDLYAPVARRRQRAQADVGSAPARSGPVARRLDDRVRTENRPGQRRSRVDSSDERGRTVRDLPKRRAARRRTGHVLRRTPLVARRPHDRGGAPPAEGALPEIVARRRGGAKRCASSPRTRVRASRCPHGGPTAEPWSLRPRRRKRRSTSSNFRSTGRRRVN